MNHALLLLTLLIASGLAHAQSRPATEGTAEQQVYTYALELDADGRVAAFSPHGFAPDAISRELDWQIGAWIFEAPAADAGPVSTDTWLRIVVAPQNGVAGEFDVVSAMTGPAPERLVHPDYSVRDQLAGRQGVVVLKLQVGADGRVSAAQVHDIVGRVSRDMAQDSEASALDWRFSPERVDGQPLASTILWPVCFLGAKASASDCTWQGPDAQNFSSKTVLTLNPAARLVTPLAFEGR